MATEAPLVAIGICTYRRDAGLARALKHLRSAVSALPYSSLIVIVDNDGSRPETLEIVKASLEDTPYVYRIERVPGISAARNAIVSEASARAVRYLAMLDDDEWPTEQWLVALLRTALESSAAVVGGPVEPQFPSETAARVRRYRRYWAVEPQHLQGKTFVFCTCNFLVDMAQLADVEQPFFEEKFGLTGGGDTAFFRRLFHLGKVMAWAADATLYEEVTPQRSTLTWMRARKFRVGNHAVAWEAAGASGIGILAKTLGLTLRLPIYPLLGRDRGTELVGWVLEAQKVLGRWSAHTGSIVAEYARQGPAEQRPCR